MVLRVDHHEDSMVDTSFTCALALQGKRTHTASSRRTNRVIVEVLLKFFILMWFVILLAGQFERRFEFLVRSRISGYIHITIILVRIFIFWILIPE